MLVIRSVKKCLIVCEHFCYEFISRTSSNTEFLHKTEQTSIAILKLRHMPTRAINLIHGEKNMCND